MSLNKRLIFALCATCFLAAGCADGDGLTASGSDEWSRGVILGSTEANPVAVAMWEETTFVAWVAENGHLQLAQLDAALNLESVTGLPATVSVYGHSLRLWAEASDRLHLVWLDGVDTVPSEWPSRQANGVPSEWPSRQANGVPSEGLFQQADDVPSEGLFQQADDVPSEGLFQQADDVPSEGPFQQANGVPTVVHALVTPGQAEAVFWQEILLLPGARYVETVARPEAGRLDIFWSDLSQRNSGLYYQAVTLTGDEMSPVVRLTETGWQPRVGWAASGVMHVAWADWDQESAGYATGWYARFDPESGSLDGATPLAGVRIRRGQIFQGPLVGQAGARAVVAWRAGNRTVDRGLFDRRWYGSDFGGAFRSSHTTEGAIRGDDVQYALLSDAPAEMALSVHPLATANVVVSWDNARMRTAQDRTWIISSAWVARRSNVRLQIIVLPFDEDGQGAPVVVTKTWPLSMWPDLAVGADGVLRAVWCEPLGDDVYQVVVASTAPEALDALGGFRPREWWGDVLTLWTDFFGLLGFLPMVSSWLLLPLGLMLVGVFANPDGLRKRQAVAWLGMAVLLQLTCKRFLFPNLLPLGLGPVGLGLTVAPIVLGIGLMWVYWRRADEPLLVAAFGLFASTEVIFSLFVVMPRVLWAG